MPAIENDASPNPKETRTIDSTSDEQLMLAFSRGRMEAFAELFRRYKQPLFGFFRRRVADPGRAEELTQDAFVAVLRGAARYEPTALFRTYLYAIGLNILRAHRRKAAFRATFLGENSDNREPAVQNTADTDLILRDALGKLDRQEREILMLREFEQLSYAEIADLLDMPVNTVRSRLFRARTALRDLLSAPARPTAKGLVETLVEPKGARMNPTAHSVAPEDVMAYLDGELLPSEAQAMSAHLEHCAECSNVAAQFRNTSQWLSAWDVPALPAKVEHAVEEMAANAAAGRKVRRPNVWAGRWKMWTLGGGVLATASLFTFFILPARREITSPVRYSALQQMEMENNVVPADSTDMAAMRLAPTMTNEDGAPPIADRRFAGSPLTALNGEGLAKKAQNAAPVVAAPMIARTATLSIVTKDFAASRSAPDTILARHHGYSANLTVLTAQSSSRAIRASLRIPAPEFGAAIKDFETLGRIETESQSGEEVTQQHADLVARLKTARETEERFRGILQQRTGSIADVLEVEESISRVRGEIETMEAEQQALEHRVDFATLNINLGEEYKEQFHSPDGALSRMEDALVEGYRNATGTLLGLIIFIEEYGPALLIWLAILGLPYTWSGDDTGACVREARAAADYFARGCVSS